MATITRNHFLKNLAATAAGLGFFSGLPRFGVLAQAEDSYWPAPRSDFEARRRHYLEFCASQSPGGRTGFLSQIARLELGRDPVDPDPIREAIAFVYSQGDCNDFSMAGLLRILYRYRNSSLIPRELIADIEKCVLGFKYWWNEPGIDDRCYHTENHQIIYHADQLLAGQLLPDQTFANSGKTGRYHIEHALHLIRRWMDFRVWFGFSEWLSNCYFEEDLMALANLRDFAEAPDIRQKAELLIDLILFEMALHTYQGVFGCTHGRSYARLIKGGRQESSASTAKLMFGMGLFNKPDAYGAVFLATSSYRCPGIIEKIAADLQEPMLCKERHSINIDDAPKYGLSYDKEEDGLLYWSIQEYIHPKVIDLSQWISKTYGVRKFEDYQKYVDQYQQQIRKYGRIINPDLSHKALTEVHIQTYRTSDYLLSCAQDYRPGRGGYQQHIWQTTLGIDAVVFTNHPGSEDENSRPNFWAGNGIMPRAAQHRNVLFCIHKVPADDHLPFSHAYFPRDSFDEVVERGHWVCARKGDGYIALYSEHAPQWRKDDQGKPVELMVDSPENIWVCEMGSRKQSRSFSEYVSTVTSASIECNGSRVQYSSPSIGMVGFGWEGPLKVKGNIITLHNYDRFDNPYCQSKFTDPVVIIKRGNAYVHLDFQRNKRVISK